MGHVHAEYIKETPSFVRVDMQLSKSKACDAAKYVYGPYTLQKVKAGANPSTGGSTKPKAHSVKVGADSGEEAQVQKKKGSKQPQKDTPVGVYQYKTKNGMSVDRTLSHVRDYITSTVRMMKNKGVLTNEEIANKCKALVKDVIALNQNQGLTEDNLNVDCDTRAKASKFGVKPKKGADDDVDDDEDDDEDEGDDVNDGKADDPITKTDAKAAKTKSTKKAKGAGDDEKETTTVHIDCWFYTGLVTGTEKVDIENMVIAAATKEGVLDDNQTPEVRATITTITGSAPCISSSLLSPTTTAMETALVVDQADQAAVSVVVPPSGDGDDTLSFGTKKTHVYVDFNDFKKGCIIDYIKSKVLCTAKGMKAVPVVEAAKSDEADGAADGADGADGAGGAGGAGGATKSDGAGKADKDTVTDEAGGVGGAGGVVGDSGVDVADGGDAEGDTKADDGAESDSPAETSEGDTSSTKKDEKSVWIFYTVAPTEPVKDAGKTKEGKGKNNKEKDNKKVQNAGDQLNGATFTSKSVSGKKAKIALRRYVPSVLAEPIVLDAMVDLVVRLVETPPDYDTASRVVQTIMLSDTSYHHGENSAASLPTSLVSMDTEPVAGKADATGKADAPSADDPVAHETSASSLVVGTKTNKFGNKMTTLTTALKAAFSSESGDLYISQNIVDKLYRIKLDGKVSLHDFYGAVPQENDPEKSTSKKLIVQNQSEIPTVDRDKVMMYPFVTKDYMVVVTKKAGKQGSTGKPKADVFKLFKLTSTSKPAFEVTIPLLAKEIIGIHKTISPDSATRMINEGTLIPKPDGGKKTAKTFFLRPLYGDDDDNQASQETKQRAIRIILSHEDDGTSRIIQDARIVSHITKLDELFLHHKLDENYKWHNGPLHNNLKAFDVPVDKYSWHGDRSLQRIVAQYAAFKLKARDVDVDDFLFSTNTTKPMSTRDLMNDETIEERYEKKAKYLTWTLVRALRDQNFGALFTSQPNFSTKPVYDKETNKKEYDAEFDDAFKEFINAETDRIRPNCGKSNGGSDSEIKEYKDENTIDLHALNNAVSFVEGLIARGVLVKKKKPKISLRTYKETLEALDDLLSGIYDSKNIERYTTGGAGSSTDYEAMVGQSMKCFVLFLPLIERMVRKKYENESKDFVRSKALSYGCVSHGLDPKHIIAVRYAMIKDKKTYNSRSYSLSRTICEQLFGLLEEKSPGPDSFPLTRELMRARVLGAITVIEDVKKRGLVPSKFGMRSFV
jgi:hypothetical protein